MAIFSTASRRIGRGSAKVNRANPRPASPHSAPSVIATPRVRKCAAGSAMPVARKSSQARYVPSGGVSRPGA